MEQPEVVELARQRPWSGQDWAVDLLAAFPEVLARTVDRWGLVIERAHTDGVGLPVLEVRRGDEPAVVKFDDAGTDLPQQVRVMSAAQGRGYARVLDHADDLGAALLERLGLSLAQATPDGVEQVDVLVGLLEQAWELPLAVGSQDRPGEKAEQLLAIVETEVAEGGWVHRHRASLDRAAGLARDLVAAPGTDVVVAHGDPHSLNALQRGTDEEFAFIDPDGFLCEREYDVGVVLRDLMREIEMAVAAAGGAGVRGVARRWHETQVMRVSRRMGLNAERVSAWAFTERVCTGIWLHRLGFEDEAERWLTTADLLVP
ncbi:aminoglycoside phosphotransferase family protein [Serinicoccus sp. LYQ131]|uniref:aminoglycoside phosphotransferase family protein n=1 Tax=Serinicoccus sp. LYQ131 TaxID=3378797 RepID=UPI0038543B25